MRTTYSSPTVRTCPLVNIDLKILGGVVVGGFWDKERELIKVAKSGTKSAYYKFTAVEKNGKSYIDVREHFDRIDGTTQHTAKGISIPTTMFAEMAEGFQTALDSYLKG
jgi:hypothetical protein